jgi:hypothetical protein
VNKLIFFPFYRRTENGLLYGGVCAIRGGEFRDTETSMLI